MPAKQFTPSNDTQTRLKARVLDVSEHSIQLAVEFVLENRIIAVAAHLVPSKLRKKGSNIWLVRTGKDVTCHPWHN